MTLPLRIVATPEDELRSLLRSLERAEQTRREILAAMLPLRQQYARDRGEFVPPSVERLKMELLG